LKQSKFPDAIGVLEELLSIYTQSERIAATLNMLGLLYRDTQRMKDAEQAHQDAMAIYTTLVVSATQMVIY
jgi:hypothetical protein